MRFTFLGHPPAKACASEGDPVELPALGLGHWRVGEARTVTPEQVDVLRRRPDLFREMTDPTPDSSPSAGTADPTPPDAPASEENH